jgi:succinoglycan biosynthesis protein ExoO
MTCVGSKVSVVVPAFNAARTIGAAIESVVAQSHTDWELLICDDASTDDTIDVVRSFADARIRLICNPQNLGPGLSRDIAIGVATGQWIAFLDADDVWLPARLERLLQVAARYSRAIVFDELIECHDTPVGLVPWRKVRNGHCFGYRNGCEPHELEFVDFIRARRTIMQPLIPLSAIRQYDVRHDNAPYSEDLAFVIRLVACGIRLVYVPEAMYMYRLTHGSASTHGHRHGMLQRTLEHSLALFASNPEITASIRGKIAQIQYEARCHQFFLAVKSSRFGDALAALRREPRILAGFIGRVMDRIPYHIHRILHHGSGRGST